MFAIGVNCDFDTFPSLARAAMVGGSSHVFVVMYHSRTIRTPREFALLEEAVVAARALPGVEFMTTSEAVARFPERTRLLNEAGANVVPQTELAGTARARVVVYRRVGGRIGLRSRLERVYARARAAYGRGAYNEAGDCSPAIDRLCRRLLWIGRAVSAVVGAALGAGAAWLPHAMGRMPVWGAGLGVLLAMGIAGAAARWRATARDTRREIAVATVSTLAGIMVGMLLETILLEGPRS